MDKSPTIGKLAEALSKAQLQYQPIYKNCTNPFFHNKYADLAAIIEATKKALSDNGLAITQTPELSDNGKLTVTTTLMHISGEWLSGCLAMKPIKEDPQAGGSCLSYLRRYSIQSILFVAAEEEDDGNAASGTVDKPSMQKNETPKLETGALTCAELIEKMTSSANEFELAARAKKYRNAYDAMTGEEKTKVKIARDRRKTELKGKEA